MTWADFYLICFFLGFVLSVLSLLGSLHLHLPHFDVDRKGTHAGDVTPRRVEAAHAELTPRRGAEP